MLSVILQRERSFLLFALRSESSVILVCHHISFGVENDAKLAFCDGICFINSVAQVCQCCYRLNTIERCLCDGVVMGLVMSSVWLNSRVICNPVVPCDSTSLAII